MMFRARGKRKSVRGEDGDACMLSEFVLFLLPGLRESEDETW